ncbi:MAG TPA: C39 family peptidase [Candidatus Dormibacteraeota bacterium]|nr:C39 family peptidase [Candidatus Dormibacteraeota bacterium]
MKEVNSTRKRSIFNRPRRIALAAGVLVAGFLAGGWFAYALPNQPSTRTVLADTGATPTPVSTPVATPTPDATPAPTVVPTVVPTVAPTDPPVVRPPQTTFTIAVPVIRQTMVLDCETAALQMGLATYGYYYSQDTLFARENADLRAPVMGPNHTVLQWGDPYTNFVGNVNGSDWTPTGYGVYYPVILKMARDIGLTNAYGGEGMSAATIYDALSTGHAVEVWIETNWTRPGVGTWTAWDGRKIRYSYAEHAVTLSGVSPNQVRVNDPLHGTQYWVSKATFETSWADFNNMAVVF